MDKLQRCINVRLIRGEHICSEVRQNTPLHLSLYIILQHVINITDRQLRNSQYGYHPYVINI